jgi:hypothetical protein
MQTSHDRGVRDALWRLTESREALTTAPATPPPLFLRAPWVVALWGATLIAVAAVLVLGRIQVPQVARGTVVAVATDRDSVALLLLLPPASRPYVRVGQHASLDTGAGTFALDVIGVDSTLLDADTARRRFADAAGLIAHLDAPKLVVRLAWCGPTGCLTPRTGTYAATASVGTRSLASYAMSRS